MNRSAQPFTHLPDIPKGWTVDYHPSRMQPYATWHDGKLWHYDETSDEARRYVELNDSYTQIASAVRQLQGISAST